MLKKRKKAGRPVSVYSASEYLRLGCFARVDFTGIDWEWNQAAPLIDDDTRHHRNRWSELGNRLSQGRAESRAGRLEVAG